MGEIMALTVKLAALALLWGSLSAPASTVSKFNSAAVVFVDCGQKTGSAVKVGRDKYITAAHVIEDAVCYVDGVPITDVKIGPTDYATFTGPASNIKAKYVCRRYVGGEEYLALGYAMGAPFLTFESWVASRFSVGDKQMFSGEAIPGMSGGAVLDQDAKVVGIVNQRWPARSITLKDTSLCQHQ